MKAPRKNLRVQRAKELRAFSPGNKDPYARIVAKLPTHMQVAINGGSNITRRPVASLIAEKLSAVLVDAGRFYRSIAVSCMREGVDMEATDQVVAHINQLKIKTEVSRSDHPFDEAFISIGGDVFSDEELAAAYSETRKIAYLPALRKKVQEAILKVSKSPRIVVSGRDIAGDVLPDTPFKFCIDVPGINPGLALELPKRAPRCFYYSSGNANELNKTMDVMFVPKMPLEKAVRRILLEMVKQHQRRQAKDD